MQRNILLTNSEVHSNSPRGPLVLGTRLDVKKKKSSGTAFNVVKATVPGATQQNVFVGWFSLTNSIQVINFKSISDKFQLPLEST